MGEVLARIFVTVFFLFYLALALVIVSSIVKRWLRPALKRLFPAAHRPDALRPTERSKIRS